MNRAGKTGTELRFSLSKHGGFVSRRRNLFGTRVLFKVMTSQEQIHRIAQPKKFRRYSLLRLIYTRD